MSFFLSQGSDEGEQEIVTSLVITVSAVMGRIKCCYLYEFLHKMFKVIYQKCKHCFTCLERRRPSVRRSSHVHSQMTVMTIGEIHH